jgi:hypothetical protein
VEAAPVTKEVKDGVIVQ